jgi:hypothetical protein
MKTTLLCFLLVSGLFGLSFSCCSEIPKYWNLTSFQVKTMSFDGFSIPVNDTISTDTLILTLIFGQEFLSDNIPLGPNPFLSSAHATSCPDPGELGMKDELAAVNITSSAPFNNYLPETSLTPMLFIHGVPLQDWIDNKVYNQYYQNSWSILFPIKPSVSSNIHDFKISLTFDSGRIEEVQMGAFTWK